MPVLLGLDIGTTSTIGILIDSGGRTLGLAQRAATLHSPHPGWAEEDPEEWWSNVGDICRELTPGCKVAAVGVTGMLPATVLLDAGGRPVRRSIQQSDGRVAAEVPEEEENQQDDPGQGRDHLQDPP